MENYKFFQLTVNPKTKEFEHISGEIEIGFEHIEVQSAPGTSLDELRTKHLSIAAKLSANEKSIVVMDEKVNVWTIHPDLFNAYGTRVLAFIAALTSPWFDEHTGVDRRFDIVNGYEGRKASSAYKDSLQKLFGYWNFNAFCIHEEPKGMFNIEEQVFCEMLLAPPEVGSVLN